jgi:hypothetical protein
LVPSKSLPALPTHTGLLPQLMTSAEVQDLPTVHSSPAAFAEPEEPSPTVQLPPTPMPIENRPSPDHDPQPNKSAFYIHIQHHPRSGKPDETIPLDGGGLPDNEPAHPPAPARYGLEVPWAPFRTRADFEAAEICVQGRLNDPLCNRLIKSQPYWSRGESEVTLKDIHDLGRYLEKARGHVGKVRRLCARNLSLYKAEDIFSGRRPF